IFAGALDRIAQRTHPSRPVLTPHAGELGRLLGISSEDVEADRFEAARAAAARPRAVGLLKGAYTILSVPGGRVVATSTGQPALATAGAGDVLAGVVGAFTASLSPFEAAAAGAFEHGAAADAWAEEQGARTEGHVLHPADRGLLATEIAARVP